MCAAPSWTLSEKPNIVPKMGTVEEAFLFPPYCGDVNWLGEMGIQVQHTMVFSSGLIFSTLTLTVVLFSLFPHVSQSIMGDWLTQ